MSKTVRSQAEGALAASGVTAKGKGGNAKKGESHGRHPSAARYTSEQRWETNRLRRIRRHVKRHPKALDARAILDAEGTAADKALLASLPAE